MSDLERRLATLEARVQMLERRLAPGPGPTGDAAVSAPEPASAVIPPAGETAHDDWYAPPLGTSARRRSERDRGALATQVLGWSGASALVLAAAYLVRLALDAGWLTPPRQVGAAALGGLVLVAVGLGLRRHAPRYASLLPAAGVVVLFLAVYGAHLHYALIGPALATGATVAICLLALVLGRVFANDVYVLFAVLGAYATPFLSPALRADLLDLVLYYSAWSVLFCTCSLWLGGRRAYLIAMYLAVVGFDLVWRDGGGEDWVGAVVYQLVQFLLFTATAAGYSVRHASPMSREEAWSHLPALLFFYVVVWTTLDAHVAQWAPWFAFASVLVVVGAYFLVRDRIPGGDHAGAMVVSAYATLVVVHAGYAELVPDALQPWVALAALIGAGVWVGRGALERHAAWPVLAGVGLVAGASYLRLVADVDMGGVPAADALYVAHALVLYAAYALLGQRPEVVRARQTLIGAAHVAALVAVHRLVETDLLASVLWSVLAVATLVVALRTRDRILGQSAFPLFVAAGVKVLLLDLAGSAPLVRIACLAALGITLYLGGWLYQRVVLPPAPDPGRTT
ncbi:MAG: DUF2339 domain-containing protein [Ectothiorhodospiraceae bacterium]|nr:DUF2339 domain-containing protein [Ectothiorhodospiraceae bacterium]